MEDFFEEVSCNLCGADAYEVILEPTLSEEDFRVSLEQLAVPQNPTIKTARIVRCCHCGLCYANPRPRSKQLHLLYGRMSDPNSLDEMPFKLRSGFPYLRKIQMFASGRRLLDIGCYTGFFLKAAQDRGWEVLGLEPSEWAASFAKEKLQLPVITGTLEEANLGASSFDVVTLLEVLEHAADPKNFLKRVHHLLAPEGLIVVAVPDISSFFARVLKERWWFLKPVHLYYFDLKTLSCYLRQAGFQMVWKGTAGGLFSLGHLAVRLHPYLGNFSTLLSNTLVCMRLHKIGIWLNLGDLLLVCARKTK